MSSCLGAKHPLFVTLGWGRPVILTRAQPASVLGLMSNMNCWWVQISECWSTLGKVPKSQTRVGGKTLHILIANVIFQSYWLQEDHPSIHAMLPYGYYGYNCPNYVVSSCVNVCICAYIYYACVWYYKCINMNIIKCYTWDTDGIEICK